MVRFETTEISRRERRTFNNFWYLPFLDKNCINTCCLRRISSERSNPITVYIIPKLSLSETIPHFSLKTLAACLTKNTFTTNCRNSQQRNFQLISLSDLKIRVNYLFRVNPFLWKLLFGWVKNNYFYLHKEVVILKAALHRCSIILML